MKIGEQIRRLWLNVYRVKIITTFIEIEILWGDVKDIATNKSIIMISNLQYWIFVYLIN